MPEIEQITRSVFNAIDDFNRQLPSDKKVKKATDITLFGKNGTLDSLGLVNLILAAEQRIEQDLGIPISLADEGAMSQEKSPFKTVGTLVNYISLLLKEKVNQ